MTHGRPDPAAGYALLEVLVGLTVFSVGLLAVAGMSLTVAKQSLKSARETGQVLAAQGIVDSVRAAAAASPGGGSDTILVLGRRWRRSWAVRSVDAGLRRLEVDVTRRGGPGRTVTVLVGRPAGWLGVPGGSSGDAADP